MHEDINPEGLLTSYLRITLVVYEIIFGSTALAVQVVGGFFLLRAYSLAKSRGISLRFLMPLLLGPTGRGGVLKTRVHTFELIVAAGVFFTLAVVFDFLEQVSPIPPLLTLIFMLFTALSMTVAMYEIQRVVASLPGE